MQLHSFDATLHIYTQHHSCLCMGALAKQEADSSCVMYFERETKYEAICTDEQRLSVVADIWYGFSVDTL